MHLHQKSLNSGGTSRSARCASYQIHDGLEKWHRRVNKLRHSLAPHDDGQSVQSSPVAESSFEARVEELLVDSNMPANVMCSFLTDVQGQEELAKFNKLGAVSLLMQIDDEPSPDETSAVIQDDVEALFTKLSEDYDVDDANTLTSFLLEALQNLPTNRIHGHTSLARDSDLHQQYVCLAKLQEPIVLDIFDMAVQDPSRAAHIKEICHRAFMESGEALHRECQSNSDNETYFPDEFDDDDNF